MMFANRLFRDQGNTGLTDLSIALVDLGVGQPRVVDLNERHIARRLLSAVDASVDRQLTVAGTTVSIADWLAVPPHGGRVIGVAPSDD